MTSIVMMTRQTDRQTDRQTETETDRETEREREADREREREVNDGWATHCTDGLLHTVPIKHCT